jgi:hypothetical protein
MRNAPQLRNLRALADAQALLTAQARMETADSLAHESKARAALADQKSLLQTSLREWVLHIESQMLEPQQLQRLGASIAHQDDRHMELDKEVAAAASATDDSRQKLAMADAHGKLTAESIRKLVKFSVRRRDEAGARALEDRVAFVWSQA